MAHSMLPFVGPSEALASFQRELRAAAGSDATVLLQGESGAGKSAAARWLHDQGDRAAGPFVACNLAALSPTLVEAALFGHERGAFTDAHRARTGLFRRASGGTLLLDDVDHLALELQVKLLRVLQERTVEPLGSDEAVPVDVRVVATTNKDLRAEVEAERFREDLYYRLAVVTLELPPLRARTADLGELASLLTDRICERSRLRPRELSAAALRRLEGHPWPGNVRELENALERVLVLGSVPAVDGDGGRDAPVAIEAGELDFLGEACRGGAEEVARQALAQGLTVDRLTVAMMERALAEHRGNVSAAARQVGLTRRAFDYRMAHRGDKKTAGDGAAEGGASG